MKKLAVIGLFFVLGIVVSTQTDNLLVGLFVGLLIALGFSVVFVFRNLD